jgi:hypothetical protein
VQKIFHLHIRKTSGTVLFNALWKKCGKDMVLPYRSDVEIFNKMPDKEDRQKEIAATPIISGHFYRLANEIPEDYFKVTILRNPVERTISAFNHMKGDIHDSSHIKIADLSFKDAMKDPRFAHELWNGQTRALVAAAGKNFETLDDAERVNTALHTLKSLDLVGFQENLQPFYRKVRSNLNLQVRYNQKINQKVTSQGIRVADVVNFSDEVVSKNRLDIFVYFESLKIGCI